GSDAALRDDVCADVGEGRLAPAGGGGVAGDPRNISTGCDRSSIALTPRSTQRDSVSSPLIQLLPKLYGTLRPTCTPANRESGFAALAEASRTRQPGTAASASLPSSRLVNMAFSWRRR